MLQAPLPRYEVQPIASSSMLQVWPCTALRVDASQESYSFGKFEIARPESFAGSALSFAFVNLKPIVPGTGFAQCCSAMKCCGVLQTSSSNETQVHCVST